MKHLSSVTLAPDQRLNLAIAINQRGSDGIHANEQSLGFFTVEHALKCARKARRNENMGSVIDKWTEVITILEAAR